LMFNFPTF